MDHHDDAVRKDIFGITTGSAWADFVSGVLGVAGVAAAGVCVVDSSQH